LNPKPCAFSRAHVRRIFSFQEKEGTEKIWSVVGQSCFQQFCEESFSIVTRESVKLYPFFLRSIKDERTKRDITLLKKRWLFGRFPVSDGGDCYYSSMKEKKTA